MKNKILVLIFITIIFSFTFVSAITFPWQQIQQQIQPQVQSVGPESKPFLSPCEQAGGICIYTYLVCPEKYEESNLSCEKEPWLCIDLWQPVCGIDGKTYSNDCYAKRAGVEIACQDECPCKIKPRPTPLFPFPIAQFITTVKAIAPAQQIQQSVAKKCCMPIQLQGYLQVATLKKEYQVGEQVKLTDPPENNNLFELEEKILGDPDYDKDLCNYNYECGNIGCFDLIFPEKYQEKGSYEPRCCGDDKNEYYKTLMYDGKLISACCDFPNDILSVEEDLVCLSQEMEKEIIIEEIEKEIKLEKEEEGKHKQFMVTNKQGNFLSFYDTRGIKPVQLAYYDEEGKQQMINIDELGQLKQLGGEEEEPLLITKEFEGYIVEFKKKSNLRYELDIKEEVIRTQLEVESLNAYNPIKWFRATLAPKEEDIPKKIAIQKKEIKQEHIAFRKSLEKNKIKPIIINEYTDIFNGIVLKVSKEEITKIEKLPQVEKIHFNEKVNILLQNSTSLINAHKLWESGITGKDVIIAIIDTGIDYEHADLGGCFGQGCKVVDGWDFVNDDPDPMDDQGHGTHCAGIAAGTGAASNGLLKGVAPDAKLYAYKVLDSGGSGYISDIIAGIERAVDPNQDGNFSDHVDIISMSLGRFGGSPEDPDAQAVDNAVNAGVIVTVAAGNSGSDYETVGCPGCARKAITIGASNKNDEIASFSSRGPMLWGNGSIIKPDILAPGVDICAAQWDDAWSDRKCYDDKHVAISGTSMATPHVAGAAALLLQAYPEWDPAMVKSALMLNSIDLGYDVLTQGAGRLDIYEASNAEFIIFPQSIGIDLGKQSKFSKEIKIKNLKPYDLQLIFDAGNVTEYYSNKHYNLASFGPGNIIIPANSESSIFLEIDTKNLEGIFYGDILITKNTDTYSIPYIFSKLSELTLKVAGAGKDLYPCFYLHDNNFKIYKSASQGWEFEGNQHTFKIFGGRNYTAYAIGDYKDWSLEYILEDSFYIPPSSETTKVLRLSDARPFKVKARSLDNKDLDLYEWQKGFTTYDEEYHSMSVNWYDGSTAIGDRIIYLSNKPDNGLNTDIVLKFFGIPKNE